MQLVANGIEDTGKLDGPDAQRLKLVIIVGCIDVLEKRDLMRLDRNNNPDGQGKYAILNFRKLDKHRETIIIKAIKILDEAGIIEWGKPLTKDEFFLIKLRDLHSTSALKAYAKDIQLFDAEFAEEVRELADRSGKNSRFPKEPD